MRSVRAVFSVLLVVGLTTAGCTGGDGDGAAGTATPSVRSADPSAAAKSAEPEDESAESAKPDKSGQQTAVFKRTKGNDSGACIDTAGQRNVRSGGFMAGPFDDATKRWGKASDGLKKRQVQLFWVPLHAKKMKGVTVTAKKAGADPVKVTQKAIGEAEDWKYYSVVIALPEAGTWTLRGTAGVDEGCFRVTVG